MNKEDVSLKLENPARFSINASPVPFENFDFDINSEQYSGPGKKSVQGSEQVYRGDRL